MTRLFSYILLVALLVTGAVWLADRPGAVTVDWLGWRIETSVPVLLLVLLAAAALMVVALRSAIALWRLPSRIVAGRQAKRRQKGYQALSDGLAAAAGGELKRARKLSGQAEKLLADPALTSFLSSQTAKLAGDMGMAKDHFVSMLDRPETASLGLRGLLDQALERGDDEAAIELAQRALSISPSDPWLVHTLFRLLIKTSHLREAEALVTTAQRRKALAPAEAKRRRALILNERSARELPGSRPAIDLALQAVAADPGMTAAALRLAGALANAGRPRPAATVLEKAWIHQPTPELAQAYGALRPEEEPLQRVRRIETLTAGRPDDAESHLAIAEASLAARLWGQARKHLLAAVDSRPSPRPYRLLARLERSEYKNEEAARSWEAKAADAPPDPAWVCASCGNATTTWSLACPHCGAIDSLAWGRPKQAILAEGRGDAT